MRVLTALSFALVLIISAALPALAGSARVRNNTNNGAWVTLYLGGRGGHLDAYCVHSGEDITKRYTGATEWYKSALIEMKPGKDCGSSTLRNGWLRYPNANDKLNTTIEYRNGQFHK
jgi:hypothetical protein